MVFWDVLGSAIGVIAGLVASRGAAGARLALNSPLPTDPRRRLGGRRSSDFKFWADVFSIEMFKDV